MEALVIFIALCVVFQVNCQCDSPVTNYLNAAGIPFACGKLSISFLGISVIEFGIRKFNESFCNLISKMIFVWRNSVKPF